MFSTLLKVMRWPIIASIEVICLIVIPLAILSSLLFLKSENNTHTHKEKQYIENSLFKEPKYKCNITLNYQHIFYLTNSKLRSFHDEQKYELLVKIYETTLKYVRMEDSSLLFFDSCSVYYVTVYCLCMKDEIDHIVSIGRNF